MERVTVAEAAKELCIDQLTLRCLMQNKQIDIGYVTEQEGASRKNYIIYRGLLDKELKRLKGELGE